MASVKRRRSLPTVVDRGLGLLEIILPRGGSESGDSGLSGQLDASGFWFPSGYRMPGDIFTPEQRRMQDKQRAVQRRRHMGRPQTPSHASDGLVPDATPSAPHAPPAATAPTGAADPGRAGSDQAGPMPPPLHETDAHPLSRGPQEPAPAPLDRPPATARRSATADARAPESIRLNG
jgi:hypothetical protein